MEGKSRTSKDSARQKDDKSDLESKLAEQYEYFNTKIVLLEKELRKIGKRDELEIKYERLEKKINDKLTILEDKMMNLTVKISEETRERKKEIVSRNSSNENEDFSNEINNLYSVYDLFINKQKKTNKKNYLNWREIKKRIIE